MKNFVDEFFVFRYTIGSLAVLFVIILAFSDCGSRGGGGSNGGGYDSGIEDGEDGDGGSDGEDGSGVDNGNGGDDGDAVSAPEIEMIDNLWKGDWIFKMGSEYGNEKPVHRVELSPFSISTYLVTQEQYEAVMGYNPSKFKGYNLPVEMVSWYDAVEFCNELSMLAKLEPVYTISDIERDDNYRITGAKVTANRNADGYRLPTEAEWEYACRAGATSAYNTGDKISDYTGWYNGNSEGMTHEVGKKPANAWGLYDMPGNVNEWCWDWYASYSGKEQVDPWGPDSGNSRVMRGGSWANDKDFLRSACRDHGSPSGFGGGQVGFRVVRSTH